MTEDRFFNVTFYGTITVCLTIGFILGFLTYRKFEPVKLISDRLEECETKGGEYHFYNTANLKSDRCSVKDDKIKLDN